MQFARRTWFAATRSRAEGYRVERRLTSRRAARDPGTSDSTARSECHGRTVRRSMVSLRALFGISVILSFAVWGVVAALYVWPALRDLPLVRALRPILLLHAFRFVGLA